MKKKNDELELSLFCFFLLLFFFSLLLRSLSLSLYLCALFPSRPARALCPECLLYSTRAEQGSIEKKQKGFAFFLWFCLPSISIVADAL